MPTASLSGWSLTNRGPLTTTYTAPASCFTEATKNIILATPFLDRDTNTTSLVPNIGTCHVSSTIATWGDCLPSGKDIDSEYLTVDTNNPAAGSTIGYYSPGLICPSGYVTAGVATNDAGTITSSGDAFVPTATSTSGLRLVEQNPVPNVLLQALAHGETAVLCCPSSYKVELNGYCWSTLPSYPIPSIGCLRAIPTEDIDRVSTILSIFGTTITANMITYVSTAPFSKTRTSTIADPGNWTAVTRAPMVTLIHNAADTTAVANQTTVSSTTSSGSRRAVGGNWRPVALSCWVASLAAGILYTSLL